MNGDIHIIPINDLRDHAEGRDCWCKPVVAEEDAGGFIIAHNSMDRREHTIEQGRVH